MPHYLRYSVILLRFFSYVGQSERTCGTNESRPHLENEKKNGSRVLEITESGVELRTYLSTVDVDSERTITGTSSGVPRQPQLYGTYQARRPWIGEIEAHSHSLLLAD
jgi:hypothetical protein